MANAGSGKTTALTERVVRLLLLGVAPEHIVCITYTKAAASEMRARVLKKLRELLLMEETALVARVATLTEMTPSPAQLTRARLLFGMVLDSPSGGLQLTTIHGFCQNILRRFPLEAGIAPHFTILEEAAADELLRKAKHALLGGLMSADADLQAALALIGMRGGESRFDALANDIIKKRRIWQRIWQGQSPESLRVAMFALHDVAEDATREGLNRWLAEMFSAADEALIRGHLPQMLAHGTKSYREFAEGLSGWLELDAPSRAGQCAALIRLLLTKENKTSQRYMVDKKQHPEGSPLQLLMVRACETAQRYLAQFSALCCAEESFAVGILARALMQQYEAAKEARHALDYDDLILRTLQLMSLPEMLGWVMSKLDHRIDHLLIDEAQDNSGEQWELARVLVEELIAANDGRDHVGLPRSLLVVGDEKQSIYSFQGAAPEEFGRNRQLFSAMLEGSASPLAAESLLNSYRSAEAVLRLVDQVAGMPEIAAALSSSGAVQAHVLKRTEAAGQVMLHASLIAPEKTPLPPLTIPLDYGVSSHAATLLAEHIAEQIATWLQVEKCMLASEGRALKAGDILILVRHRTRMVQALIRALERRHVPVAGMDRLTLSDHLAVADLLALMRWCGNTHDDMALAQVLRSPLIGMSDEELRALAYGRAGSLWSVTQHAWLAEMLGLRHLTPYDFLTQVLEVSGRRRDFARRFGEEVHEILDELKAQAAALPADMAPTLANFHDWMTASRRQVKREQESGTHDQVRIMTVHGAKGLEAPVVILADTVSLPSTKDERFFTLRTSHGQLLPLLAMSAPAKDAVRYAEAKQEKLSKLNAEYYRLLYVALTRARDELHIFGTADKKGEIKPASWYGVVETAMQACGAEELEGALALRDVRAATPPSSPQPSTVVAADLPAWLHAHPPLETTSARAESEAVARADAISDSRSRGVRIHRILELVRTRAAFAQLAEYIAHISPDWDEDTHAQVMAQIQELHRKEMWLWEFPHQAEVAIHGVVGGVATHRQIDLLVNTGRDIVIIDYKTTANVPKAAEKVSGNYLRQLKIYQDLVRQLYPGIPVRTAILWTHNASLMWLDAAVEKYTLSELKIAG